jgi:hypothetical protein
MPSRTWLLRGSYCMVCCNISVCVTMSSWWNNINPFPNGVSQITAGSNVTISGTLARPVINAVFPTGSVVFSAVTSVAVANTAITANIVVLVTSHSAGSQTFYCVNSTGTGFTITASRAFTGTIRYAVLQY